MRGFILGMVAMFVAMTAGAQGMKDPSSWNISAAPAQNDGYRISFHVKLDAGWHIWSLAPGGDGSLIAPSFEVDPASVTAVGPISEQGIATKMAIAGVDGIVSFYSDEAMYVRDVQAKRGSTVKGSYTYQLCNDQMCLPPKTVPFSVKLP